MFALYYIAAMIFTVILITTIGKGKEWLALILAALSFGFIGFVMRPDPELYIDTVRFFNTLDNVRIYSVRGFSNGWEYLMNTEGYVSTPLIGIVLFLISLQRENGWLNFLVAFIDVSACFYLLYSQYKRHSNRNALLFGVVVFLCLFNFNAAVSGVRSFIAGSLSVCILYKFSGRTNLIAIFLYLLLVLIHPFAMVFLAIYILSTLYRRRKALFFICCLPLIFQHFIQVYLFELFNRFSFIPMFASVSFKATQYFGDTAYIEASSGFSRIRSIALFCFFLIILIVSIRKKYEFSQRYFGFAIMLTCLSLGAIPDEILFGRCVTILMVTELPLMYELIRESVENAHMLQKGSSIPFIILSIGSVIALIDNVRAGARFLIMPMTEYGILVFLILFVVTILSITASNALDSRFQRSSKNLYLRNKFNEYSHN